MPQSRAKTPRKSPKERAEDHGLSPDEVGSLDAQRVLAFLWTLAGRPDDLSEGERASFRRDRPLMIVLDNYSVHHSQMIQDALPQLEAADVYLVYLSSYSPELSDIEPIWKAVKYHEITCRSHSTLGELKRTVEAALKKKAEKLSTAYANSLHLLQQAT